MHVQNVHSTAYRSIFLSEFVTMMEMPSLLNKDPIWKTFKFVTIVCKETVAQKLLLLGFSYKALFLGT